MFNVKRWTEEDKDQQGTGFSELICWKSKAVTWCMSVLTGVYSRVENSWRWTVGCELVKSKCSVGGVSNVVRCMWQGADELSGLFWYKNQVPCGCVQCWQVYTDYTAGWGTAGDGLLHVKSKHSVGVSSVDRCIQQGGEQLEMDCYVWRAGALWVCPVLTGIYSSTYIQCMQLEVLWVGC